MFAVILVGGTDGFTLEDLQDFKTDVNNYGLLKWDIGHPSKSVNYLDLTVTIVNGRIETKTYLKPLNLHQYIPPNSAHPLWMIKGMIHSMVRTYFYQNTHRNDYWEVSMKFYRYMRERGWDRETLERMFGEAHEKVRKKPEQYVTTQEDEISNKHKLFIHLEYHPNDIPRKFIRNSWNKNCDGLLSQKASNGGINLKQMIIAYSRPRNLRDVLLKAKLQEHTGKEVSTFF